MFKDAHAQIQNVKIALLYEEEMMLVLQYSVLPQHSSAALDMLHQSLCVCCYRRDDGAFFSGRMAALSGKEFLVLKIPILE